MRPFTGEVFLATHARPSFDRPLLQNVVDFNIGVKGLRKFGRNDLIPFTHDVIAIQALNT